MMSRNLLLASTLCFFGSALPASSQQLRDLQQFAELAQRCDSSLRTTSNQAAFDNFTAVSKVFKKHRVALQNLDVVDSDTMQKLHSECFTALNVATRRSPGLGLNSGKSLPQYQHLAQAEQPMTFELALDSFAADHEQELLKATTTSQVLGRISAQALLDIIADLSKANLKKVLGKGTALNAAKMGIVTTRVATYCAVDELMPKGVSSYKQKLTELIAPIGIALVVSWLSAQNAKGRSEAVFNLTKKAFLRFMMTRALLSKNHKLYKSINAAAYALPLFAGNAFQSLVLNPDKSLKGFDEIENGVTWSKGGEMCIDWLISMLIYEVTPKLVERALPKDKIAMNPAHRRKAVKNSVRDSANVLALEYLRPLLSNLTTGA